MPWLGRQKVSVCRGFVLASVIALPAGGCPGGGPGCPGVSKQRIFYFYFFQFMSPFSPRGCRAFACPTALTCHAHPPCTHCFHHARPQRQRESPGHRSEKKITCSFAARKKKSSGCQRRIETANLRAADLPYYSGSRAHPRCFFLTTTIVRCEISEVHRAAFHTPTLCPDPRDCPSHHPRLIARGSFTLPCGRRESLPCWWLPAPQHRRRHRPSHRQRCGPIPRWMRKVFFF